MDKNSSLAKRRSYAEQVCKMIGDQDPNGRMK